MANALKRNIAEGEVVIVSSKYYRGTAAEREFVCRAGFGMKAFTSGEKIFGDWKDGTGQDSILGSYIDVVATEGRDVTETVTP